MVLSFDEQKEILRLKAELKKELEMLCHKNAMEEIQAGAKGRRLSNIPITE